MKSEKTTEVKIMTKQTYGEPTSRWLDKTPTAARATDGEQRGGACLPTTLLVWNLIT